jgi:hypothetical protein
MLVELSQRDLSLENFKTVCNIIVKCLQIDKRNTLRLITSFVKAA